MYESFTRNRKVGIKAIPFYEGVLIAIYDYIEIASKNIPIHLLHTYIFYIFCFFTVIFVRFKKK